MKKLIDNSENQSAKGINNEDGKVHTMTVDELANAWQKSVRKISHIQGLSIRTQTDWLYSARACAVGRNADQ